MSREDRNRLLHFYELGGGTLSLSTQTRGQFLSGALAILPLKNEPLAWARWKHGVDEDVLQFFGSAAEAAGSIISIIGWAQGAAGHWSRLNYA